MQIRIIKNGEVAAEFTANNQKHFESLLFRLKKNNNRKVKKYTIEVSKGDGCQVEQKGYIDPTFAMKEKIAELEKQLAEKKEVETKGGESIEPVKEKKKKDVTI